MPPFETNKNLQDLHTFQIPVYCNFFTEIFSENDFLELQKTTVFINNPKLILGGGSNVLFTKNFEGLVIKNSIPGITITWQDENFVIIKAGSGENWHNFVMHCIEKGYGGLENLSLIPGCVGAAPMQNIGAYGVEIKDCFYSLEALDMQSGEKKIFFREDCHFGYRESVFKNLYKNKYLITYVSFKLSKKPIVNTSYGAIQDELNKAGVKNPTIKDVSNAVITIRKSKLPDPLVIGNAGSFFKNPEIDEKKYLQLKKEHPGIVAYALENQKYKLAAGWLIEQAGLKGREYGGAAVHTKQALVLINNKGADGKSVYQLSEIVAKEVLHKFGVKLEREVNIIGEE